MVNSSAHSFQQKFIGSRVRAAREERQLTQQTLSQTLGFKDRQSLSAIEQGIRAVSAEELMKLMQALGHDLDYFMDPFNVAGEAKFSWRVSKEGLNVAAIAAQTAPIFGLMRWLCQANLTVLKRSLRIDEGSSIDEAHAAGSQLRRELKVGSFASIQSLRLAIESKLGILVAFLELPRGFTGGLCRLSDCEILVINRRLAPDQQVIDLLSGLFYALTHDALQPGIEMLSVNRATPGPKAERLCAGFVDGFLAKSAIEGAAERAFSLNIVERLRTALQEGNLSVRKAQKLLEFADLQALKDLFALYGLEFEL
jgi:XRE family transcriptional regulator, fatty acid utilization regulator